MHLKIVTLSSNGSCLLSISPVVQLLILDKVILKSLIPAEWYIFHHIFIWFLCFYFLVLFYPLIFVLYFSQEPLHRWINSKWWACFSWPCACKSLKFRRLKLLPMVSRLRQIRKNIRAWSRHLIFGRLWHIRNIVFTLRPVIEPDICLKALLILNCYCFSCFERSLLSA